MKIAVSSQGPTSESLVDARFGRAGCFVVYDEEQDSYASFDNKQNLQAAQGAGIQSAAAVVNAGCSALITGHCGPKAFAALSAAGVTVFPVAGGTVREALDSYRRGELKKLTAADVEGHW